MSLLEQTHLTGQDVVLILGMHECGWMALCRIQETTDMNDTNSITHTKWVTDIPPCRMGTETATTQSN